MVSLPPSSSPNCASKSDCAMSSSTADQGPVGISPNSAFTIGKVAVNATAMRKFIGQRLL